MEANSGRRRLELTERDLAVLALFADHRLALRSHVRALLGAAAAARVRRLVDAGLLREGPRFHRHPASLLITKHGLGVIGSPLPAPRSNLAEYSHDVGLAWLSVAAAQGAFGPLREIVSERAIRSREMSGAQRPLAVRIGRDADGRERLHRPDLLLVDDRGRRIAIELELTSKNAARRQRILAGYANDRRIDAVLYLVADRRTGERIARSARALGAGDLIRVQRVRIESAAPGQPGGHAPTRTRAPSRIHAPADRAGLDR